MTLAKRFDPTQAEEAGQLSQLKPAHSLAPIDFELVIPAGEAVELDPAQAGAEAIRIGLVSWADLWAVWDARP